MVLKIEFSENHFHLIVKKKLWPLKFIYVPIFTSNGFRTERGKKREPKSRLRRRWRTPSSSLTITRTRLHRSCQSQHRADCTTPLDLTSAWSRLRPTDLSLSLCVLIFVWFWFLLLWWCGTGVLVVVAFDCRSLLSWVKLEFWWCVVLGFGCDLFRGLGFGCDFEIFCNKNLFGC